MGCYEAVYNAATDFMTEHRGIFVTFFVLPISLLYDAWFAIRAWLVFKFYSAPDLHAQRVVEIQKQLRAWKEGGAKNKLCTARGGWQSMSPSLRPYKATSSKIHINLYDILHLDKDAGYVHVEPMVNMGQLSHFLLQHELTIPVLPEMDDLTVGGLYMGVGIEASSHKYGLFNDSVIEAEVALSNGDVVTCSKTENRDLYDALPWSYGTLGFLLSVKISVIPASRFVKIEYIPCHSQAESSAKFREMCTMENPPDFMEALAYSKDTCVVMPTNFVDAAEAKAAGVNYIGRWYKPWFYKHVEETLTTGHKIEYLSTREYYHRHTKSIFWELEQIIPWGNHPLFRWLLGWAVPPKVSFLKLTQTEAIRRLYETQHVIQDMLVPMSKLEESLDKFDEQYDLYPLWLCPYAAFDYTSREAPHRCFLRRPKELQEGKDWEMYVDLGAYGIPRAVIEKRPFDIVKCSKNVESFVYSVRGFQMLYADTYQTREEFYAMFDHSHYKEMKKRCDADDGFPEVYEKVCMRSRSRVVKPSPDGNDTAPLLTSK